MFPIPIKIQVIDNHILNFLDDNSIKNLLISNKSIFKYYSNDNYWLYRINNEFNTYRDAIYRYKSSRYSWLCYYFRLRKCMNLNLRLLCKSKCLDILKIKVETSIQEKGTTYYYHNELLSPCFRCMYISEFYYSKIYLFQNY